MVCRVINGSPSPINGLLRRSPRIRLACMDQHYQIEPLDPYLQETVADTAMRPVEH